jgi:hypothetical protein
MRRHEPSLDVSTMRGHKNQTSKPWSTASYKHVWPSQLILFAEYLDANKPPGLTMLELEQLP